MNNNKPFIYICSLPRTGSTILAESLISNPGCFIHNESLLACGHYHWEQLDFLPDRGFNKEDLLALRDSTVKSYIEKYNQNPTNINIWELYRRNFVEAGRDIYEQFGIKELKHSKWRNLVGEFSNLKTVVTCRDPRDIYASILNMKSTFTAGWTFEKLDLEGIALELLSEFENQKMIIEHTDHIIVRYEEFCSNPAIFARVGEFIGLSELRPASIGCYTRGNSLKKWEVEQRNGNIDASSVGRHKRSQSGPGEYDEFMGMMKDYIAYFNY